MSSVRGAGSLLSSTRSALALVAVVLAVVLPDVVGGSTALGAVNPDRAVTWSGPVRARSVPIPGSEGGFRTTILASYRLWLPSGGTWQVESALSATGVRKVSAPGSAYGRVSFGHAVECGPDARDRTGRLTTRATYGLSGTNLLYDRRTTTTVRALWTATKGYNRCQVLTFVGRDDLAVAGKSFALNGGYVRLVGRGLSDGQTTSVQLSPARSLSRSTPSLTAPNFQTSFTAPAQLAVAGSAVQQPPVRYLDVVADGYVTTCYSAGDISLGAVMGVRVPSAGAALSCPRAGGVRTVALYQSMAVVQQYNADGTVCRQTASPLRSYRTTGIVHHQEVRNRLVVLVNPACDSRLFRVKLFLRWTGGNPFWVESPYFTRLTVRAMAG
jgi:hypothetical protein